MKMWAGRFQSETNALVNDFNASIHFDQRLYPYDIQGSIAHSQMLQKQGILSEEDQKQIEQGLLEILDEIQEGKIEFTSEYEDIHMCIEQLLTEKIGAAGKRLHTARSRNDQVALDMRLFVKDHIQKIQSQIIVLSQELLSLAKSNLTTIMPGYTHLQRAQPITFAHTIMAYAQMLRRDLIRLSNTYSLMNESPLGSGALATTTYPIDRFYSAALLGFYKPTSNSIDGVSDRDYCLELLSDLSILMMHLSRFSEEIIAWCSWEFKFIELDDAYATGSSIMPQKKNPDICELVRGKTGRVYGDMMALFTTLKGLPLAYNKDMQEDKESVFDAIDTVEMCLSVLPKMCQTMTLYTNTMYQAAKKGFLNATDCADYLTKKGLPFRDAYKITGQIVAFCNKKGASLDELSLQTLKEFHPLFEENVFEAIDLLNCVKQRNVYGGPSPEQVEIQIKEITRFLAKMEAEHE